LKKAFISYRRQETEGQAQSLCLRLKIRFSNEQIFMDVDDIKPTEDFVEVLKNNLKSCAVLIVLIGRNWTKLTDSSGNRRLDNPEDFVRIEVATALERGIPVLPVLVGGAVMPLSTELPDDLKALARRQAVAMSGATYEYGMEKVVASIEEQFGVESFKDSNHSAPPPPAENPWYKKKAITYPLSILLTLMIIGIFAEEEDFEPDDSETAITTFNRDDYTTVSDFINQQQHQQAIGVPAFGLAKVMSPPSNIRAQPNGAVICQATSSSIINVNIEPIFESDGDEWYWTNFCGPNQIGVIHESQIRLR
jgi:hypothetical protein